MRLRSFLVGLVLSLALGGVHAQLINMASGKTAVQLPSTPPPASGLWTWEVPDQADEQAYYDNIVGYTWAAGDKNVAFSGTYGAGTGAGRDLHNDTEGDDLWSHYQNYRRTGDAKYSAWTTGWRTYYVNGNYLTDLQAGDEVNQEYYDHLYCPGLVVYGHFNSDQTAIDAAEAILAEAFATDNPSSWNMSRNESRGFARWLLCATYLAQETGESQHITWRDTLINRWLASPDFLTGIIGGNYMADDDNFPAGSAGTPDVNGGANQYRYAQGRRWGSAFSWGIQNEALYRAYLATGRADVRARLESIAWWTYYYALNPTYVNPMTSGRYGMETASGNARWQREADSGSATVSTAAAEYSTATVNTMVIGYKLTGYKPMLTMAQQLWRQGTRWAAAAYGANPLVTALDVHHYTDTLCSDECRNFDYNKGELQYNYLLFENGGVPDVIATESTSSFATQAAALTAGQWAQLTGATNTAVLVDSAPGGVGHILPYADKMPCDPITKECYLSGSDDPGAGRRMVAFDYENMDWELISGTVDSTQRGVAHIYGQQGMDIRNRRYIFGSAGTVNGGVSVLNLDTGSVSTTYATGISGSEDAPALEYFPERSASYYIRLTTLYTRPENASSWTNTGTTQSTSYHEVMNYGSSCKCIVFGGGNDTGNNLYRINRDGTVTSLGNSAGFGIDSVRTEWVENPATGVFWVFYHNNGDEQFRTFNATTNTWTNPGVGGIPTAVFSSNDFENKLQMVATLVPEHGVMLFVAGNSFGGGNISMWIYKYRDNVTGAAFDLPTAIEAANDDEYRLAA